MPISKDDERAERITQLQALVENDKVRLPQFDRPALDTLLSELQEQERKTHRLKTVGWVVAVIVLLALAALFYHRLT